MPKKLKRSERGSALAQLQYKAAYKCGTEAICRHCDAFHPEDSDVGWCLARFEKQFEYGLCMNWSPC